MRRFFAFAALSAALLSGFFFSCSDGVQAEEDSAAVGADCGSVRLSLAVPRFIVPDAAVGGRMVMPCTSVIKFYIYTDASATTVSYSKEFNVLSSGSNVLNGGVKDYAYVTAQLNDVPTGSYGSNRMKVELYDSKGNLLTSAKNLVSVNVSSEGTPATVSFLAEPPESSVVEISNSDLEGSGKSVDCSVSAATLAGYDIYYKVYKADVPDGYSLNVTLTATNGNGGEVAVAVYDDECNLSDAAVVVKSDSVFSGTSLVESPLPGGMEYYVVFYSKAVLSSASLRFSLTEE